MTRWCLRAKIRQLAAFTWQSMWDHSLPTRAASVAFNSMFAAVPLLMLASYIAGHLLPDLSGHGQPGIGNLTADQLHAALRAFFPEMIYNVVAQVLLNMQAHVPGTIVSATLVVALWTSSSAFVDIIDALNRIYGVEEKRSMIKLRLTAIGMTLIQAVIVFLCMTIVLVSPHFLEWLHLRSEHALMITALEWLLLYLMLMLSYHLTFRVGPSSAQSHIWLTPGAMFGATVFLGASWLFRFYIQDIAHYAAWYGPLAGVMALMFWFYIISWVLLAAAQINRLVAIAANKE
jgi:membrane protein